MGLRRLLKTSAKAPTLTAKAKAAVNGKAREVAHKVGNGRDCIVCDKPLLNRSKKSNIHPGCANKAVTW